MFRRRWFIIANVNESPIDEVPPASVEPSAKRAIIMDGEEDDFIVEYDTTIGTRNTMRLEAASYEDAIEETKSFLGITDDRDEHGTFWEIQ